jgi:plastocyanin/uncharacterized membrane protein
MLTFDGLPLHPLIVHAPVVLLPLVLVGLVVVLVRPSVRPVLAPIVALLAIGAAVTAVGAAWSGEQLGDALGRGDELAVHETWGNLTRTFAVIVALGATALAAADRFVPRRPPIVSGLGIVTTGLAIAAVGVVGVAGHGGARLAWEGKVSQVGSAADPAPVPATPADDAAGDGRGTQPLDPPAEGRADPPAAPPLHGAGNPGVDVVLGEWALVPSVEQAPPGTITFRFQNLGTLPHALRIRAESPEGRLEWRSDTVDPGESGLLVAELGPGSYEIDCPVEDGHGEHDALGMEMVFTVSDDAQPLAALAAGEHAAAGGDQVAGDDAASDGLLPSEAGGHVTIEVRSFAFEPPDVTVAVGAAVTFVNRDPAPHTATGGALDTGRLEQGTSSTVTVTEPGPVDYLCTIHPAMRGRLTAVP